jgi:hypothetical protein
VIVTAWYNLTNLIRSNEETAARDTIEADKRVKDFTTKYGSPSRFETWCVWPAFERRKLVDKYADTPASYVTEMYGNDNKNIMRFVLSGKEKTLRLVRGIAASALGVVPAYGGVCEAHRLNIYYDVRQKKIVGLIDVTVRYTGHPDIDGWGISNLEVTDTDAMPRKIDNS